MAVPITRIPLYTAPCSCSTLHAINIVRALSVHGLWTFRELGRDFSPFDQRQNVRTKVCAEMPLTLQCAVLYGALLCQGSQLSFAFCLRG